jgi:hypothetical protein
MSDHRVIPPTENGLANCRTADPDAMFPEPLKKREVAAAKRVCAGCPFELRKACREYALGFAPTSLPGVWGGLSEGERRRERKRRRAATAQSSVALAV